MNFRLHGPTQHLKDQTLAAAHAAWLIDSRDAASRSSIVPYAAAMAATLLLFVTIDTLGNRAHEPWQSTHTLTARQFQTPHNEETVSDEFARRDRVVWAISHWSETHYRGFRHQLQTLIE